MKDLIAHAIYKIEIQIVACLFIIALRSTKWIS